MKVMALHNQSVQGMSDWLPFMFGVIYSTVKACVSHVSHMIWSLQKMRGKIQSAYHQLCCLAAYISKWQCFLKQSLGMKGHLILYQSIGNAILDEVVKEKCHVSHIPKNSHTHTHSKIGCSCAYYTYLVMNSRGFDWQGQPTNTSDRYAEVSFGKLLQQ